MKSLVWLRNDLRMDDNPALRDACVVSDEVSCIYIYSKDQIKLHNEANCKTEFIISNLKNLSSSLKKINVILDKDSGEPRLSHKIDISTGMYKGRQILTKKTKENN